MRSNRVIWENSLNSVAGVLIKDRREDRDTEEKSAEIGGMWLQAKGCQEPPESGRGRKDSPPELLVGARPRWHLISDLWPPGSERAGTFCCCKPADCIHLSPVAPQVPLL